MSRKALLPPALGALLLLGGCGSLPNLQIQNPTYILREVRPNVSIALPLSASSIDLDFTVDVDNPNPVSLRLDRIDFDVFVNDSHTINGLTNDRVKIPARGIGEVRLHTRIGYDDLRSAFRQIAGVIQGNQAKYELRGNAYYDTPAGTMQFPFNVVRTRL
jgi:Late embryogenesis abundant protein